MKKIKFWFCLPLCLVLLAQVNAQDLPPEDLAPSTMTMPWETFYSLWEQAKDIELERQQKFSYGKSLFIGTAKKNEENFLIAFKASFIVNSHATETILVPLMTNDVNLESLTIDNETSTWADKDGKLQILLESPGEHIVQAKFTKQISANKWPRELSLPLIPIPQTEIVLHVPDKSIEAELDPGVIIEPIESQTGTQLRGFIAPSNQVSLKWHQKSQETQNQNLKMGATIYSYVSLDEDGTSSQVRVNFRILQGMTNVFSLIVPKGLDILDVKTETNGAMAQWYTDEKDGVRTLYVYSAYQQNEAFGFQLDYETNVPAGDYDFSQPWLLPNHIERLEQHVVLGSHSNVQINPVMQENLQAMDVRFLPDSLVGLANNKALFYYKATDASAKLAFQVKAHEHLALMQSSIESIEAVSVLTRDGKTLTKVTYLLKNSQDQFLKLTLPFNATLLSVFLTGKEIQPGQDQDGDLLVPIIKSPDQAYPVEIAYLYEDAALGSLGKHKLNLPATKLPIAKLNWRLHTPTDVQLIYYGGNIEVTKPGHRLPDSISQHGFINQAWAGAIGASESEPLYQYESRGLKKRFKPAVMQDQAEEKTSAQVQVSIPLAGTLHMFSSYLISGFVPEISFLYIDELVHTFIGWLGGLFCFGLVFFTLARFFERFHCPKFWLSTKNFYGTYLLVVGLGGVGSLLNLNIDWYLQLASALAVAAFALWQNRKIAHRFHIQVTTQWRFLTEIFLTGLITCLLSTFLLDYLLLMTCLALGSILFHALFNKLVPSFRHWMNQIRPPRGQRISFIIFFFMTVLLVPVLSRAREVPLPPIEKTAQGEVHLNWDVIEVILKKIASHKRDQKNQLDINYTVGTATITGEIYQKFAELKITVPIHVLSPTYIEIPILSENIAITEALLGKKPLALNTDNNSIYFETIKTGKDKFDLELEVIVPVREVSGVSELQLNSPLIKGAQLELGFDEIIQSIQLKETAWHQQKDNKIKASLGQTEQLRVELATFERNESTTKADLQQAKKIYATTHTLLSLGEGVGDLYSSVRYRILNQSLSEFSLTLPSAVIVHEIVGKDLDSWSKANTKEGFTTYQAKTLYPVSDSFELSLHYEMQLKDFAKPFAVPNIIIENVARDVGYLGIEMKTRGEVFLKAVSNIRTVDIRDLPDIIGQSADNPIVFALRYLQQPFQVELEVKEQEPMPMVAALADNIHYTHVISPEGKIMTEVQMMVRNSRLQFATLTLPSGAKLLSSFLDGVAVKPSINEKNEILLPLQHQSQKSFSLEFIYSAAELKLNNILGTAKLEFPRLDIQASTVTSDVYAPSKLNFHRLSGDFSTREEYNYLPWYQNSSNADEIFGDEAGQANDSSGPVLPMPAHLEQKPITGTLPLRIEIPQFGRLTSLTALYVPANTQLESVFWYHHHGLETVGDIFFLLIFGALGFMASAMHSRASKTGISLVIVIGLGVIVASISWKIILLCLCFGLGLQQILAWLKRRQRFA